MHCYKRFVHETNEYTNHRRIYLIAPVPLYIQRIVLYASVRSKRG